MDMDPKEWSLEERQAWAKGRVGVTSGDRTLTWSPDDADDQWGNLVTYVYIQCFDNKNNTNIHAIYLLPGFLVRFVAHAEEIMKTFSKETTGASIREFLKEREAYIPPAPDELAG